MLRRTLPVLPAPANLAALPARLFAAVQAQWPAAGTDFDLDSPLLEVDALEFVHAYGEQNHSVAARAIYIDTVRRLAASIDSTGSILQEVLPAPGRIMQGRFLATHAMLLDHFLAVAALENDAACASAAQRVASWMTTVLFEPRSGLFRAAQGTLAIEAGKAVLTSAERARMQGGGHARFPAPAVVPFAPTGANAQAAAALSRFPGKTADAERFRGLGRRVFAVLSAAPRPGGRVPHDYALTPAGGLQPGEIDTAIDAAEWGLALLAAAPALSVDVRATRLAAARAQGDELLTRFAANDIGAFYDVPPPDSLAPERARLRLAPLADNARVSLFLIELARATGQAPYRDAGVRALEAWGYSVRGQSPWTASLYGTAVLAALRH